MAGVAMPGMVDAFRPYLLDLLFSSPLEVADNHHVELFDYCALPTRCATLSS